MPLRVGRNASEVFEHANPKAILVVLMHKISQLAKADGLQEARALLRKWVIALSTKHNLARSESQGQPIDSPEQVRMADFR